MASQISHIIYADKFLRENTWAKEKIKDLKEFMLGVLFPDIRRVSNATREETHLCFEKLDLNFSGMSIFQAGWKFHVWCDLRRNEVLRDLGFYELKKIKESYYLSYYFLEDQLIWDEYRNWKELTDFLSQPPFFQIFDHLGKNDWNFWYQAVAEYLKNEPNEKSIIDFLTKQPGLFGKKERILKEFEDLGKDKSVKKKLELVKDLILI